MKNAYPFAAAAALLCAGIAAPARAQSADLHGWTAAGDVAVTSNTAATLTTAFQDEAPVSSGFALLYGDLETALTLPVGSLAADTFEGSGLQQSFVAVAGTTVSFNWLLATVGFEAGQADRAFVLVDGSPTELPLGTVAASTLAGSFSHTFASDGNHALAILVMDVNTADLVSTLTVTDFSVSAVPEPGQWAMWLAGLGALGWRLRRRQR